MFWLERSWGSLHMNKEEGWSVGVFPEVFHEWLLNSVHYAAYLAHLVMLVQVLDKVDFPYLYLS